MALTLQFHDTDPLPLEAEGLRPDLFLDRGVDDVCRAIVWRGKQQVEAGELFEIAGDPRDGCWRMEGALDRVHYLGAGMTAGELQIAGGVGRHVGAGMRGGEIRVEGGAGDWLGTEMRGGAIEVTGGAGEGVGAAYPGSRRGMRGGRLVVRGEAGSQLGAYMRRGWIIVGGDCGELAGYRMLAGSIFVLGECAERAGAEMRRGTIALGGKRRTRLMPTFRSAGMQELPMLRLMNKELAALRLEQFPTTVELHHGDLLYGGRGEILLASP